MEGSVSIIKHCAELPGRLFSVIPTYPDFACPYGSALQSGLTCDNPPGYVYNHQRRPGGSALIVIKFLQLFPLFSFLLAKIGANI